jgi:hypothetical protein
MHEAQPTAVPVRPPEQSGQVESWFAASKKRVAIAASTGLLALAGAYEALQLTDSELANAAQANVTYRYSKLKPQSILNSIHRTVLPIDQEKSIKPTAAFMRASTAGFRTDCHVHASYKYYTVSPLGTAEQPCGYGTPYIQKSQINQYQPALDKLGTVIRKSVGLQGQQETEAISGNRKKVTAMYTCPEGDQSVTTGPSVRSITLRLLRKPTKTHKSRASIISC